ncbi:hypothetical protein NTE16_001801 [Vibrio mimicus]
MAKFNSETGAVSGSKSRRGKAKVLDINSHDDAELVQKALAGEYGAVTQRQVLLLVIQNHLKCQERLNKQRIDEENMVSASYLKHLSRAELEVIMGNSGAQSG